nr:hypothetical protein [Tanacetum cinerariifolium]
MLVAQEVGEGVANEEHDEGVPAVGVVTKGDVSVAHDEVPTVNEEPSIPSPTPPTPSPQPSHNIPFTSQDDKEIDDKEVVDAAKDVQDDIDEILVVTLTAAPTRVTAAPSRRRKGVVIRDPQEESTTSIIIPAETKSKDTGKGILVEEPKPLKKQQQIEQDKKYARELEAKLNKNIDWDKVIDHVKKKAKEDPDNVAGFKMDYFKGMSYDDIRPIFKAKFNSNMAFLKKKKEQIEEEERRALKRINETPAEKAVKRRKLDEEIEELKRHLQIVSNEDDDVYTEATLLARKVPVVDYEIIEQNNKPYYKII